MDLLAQNHFALAVAGTALLARLPMSWYWVLVVFSIYVNTTLLVVGFKAKKLEENLQIAFARKYLYSPLYFYCASALVAGLVFLLTGPPRNKSGEIAFVVCCGVFALLLLPAVYVDEESLKSKPLLCLFTWCYKVKRKNAVSEEVAAAPTGEKEVAGAKAPSAQQMV